MKYATEIAQAFKDEDLNLCHLLCMHYLGMEGGGALTLYEIRAASGYCLTSLTNHLQALEERGFVESIRTARGGRCKQNTYAITGKGIDFLNREEP